MFVLPENSSACWRKPSSRHRPGTVLWGLEDPLREPRPQGPLLYKQPAHTGEPLSCPAKQRRLFVLYARQSERTSQWPQCSSEGRWEGLGWGWVAVMVGSSGECNSIGSLCERRRGASESEGSESEADLQQVTCSPLTCFPWGRWGASARTRPNLNGSAVKKKIPQGTAETPGGR